MAQLDDLMAPGAELPSEAAAPPAVEKEEVNYRAAEEGISCSTCNNFVAPDACLVVNGKVAEDGLCDVHEPKTDAAGDVESMLFGGV